MGQTKKGLYIGGPGRNLRRITTTFILFRDGES